MNPSNLSQAFLATTLILSLTSVSYGSPDDHGRGHAASHEPSHGGGHSSSESSRNSEPRREEPRRAEPRREAPRREEPRREEPRRAEPRREEPRREQPRREEPRRTEPAPRQQPSRDQNRDQNRGQNGNQNHANDNRRDQPRRDQPRREEPRRTEPQHGQPNQVRRGGHIDDSRRHSVQAPRDIRDVGVRNVVRHDRPSHFDRDETRRNYERSQRNIEICRKDVRYEGAVRFHREHYFRDYGPRYHKRERIYRGYHDDVSLRFYYSPWFRHGFFGGYYYPVRTCEIDIFLDYPVVFWLYSPIYDPDIYGRWYHGYVVPFRYTRIYYPTDVIRDMAIEVSAMPEKVQGLFRQDMVNLTEALAQQIANDLHSSITLNENEIVINHYENLRNQAMVLSGFVDHGDIHAAFKALLDLRDPSQTLVFVPTSQEPTAEDLRTLDLINSKIQALGGNPYQADEEPLVSTNNP